MMLIPVRKVGAAALSLLFLLFSSQLSPGQNRDIQPPPDRAAKPDDGIDVQARGPVHEAYAQPYERNPGPTAVVPKKPPAPVPEEPPDQKPKGDNVQWIPGYWAWDSDKNDFLWVSGTWRATPPDRKWTPGHWTQVDNGWQWVPGLWQAADQQDLQYLPEPPANLDNGPSTLAPDDNSFYVPGIWQYRNSDYVWRPGYWYQQYPGWVWNPATYYWTPSGYCYASGYWDYPLADRGLLFAPAYFNRPLWQTPGWFYRPSFVIGFDGLFGSLFIGRHHHHFFFGDYYDPFYARAGFWPWYSYGRHYHDPLFSY